MRRARHSLFLSIVIGLIAGPTTAHAATMPMLTNGSLTGSPGLGVVAPGWVRFSGTPDLADADGPFNNTGMPWVLSPDGGTFARGIGTGDGDQESFQQTVDGFTIGAAYTLSFFQTNLGWTDGGFVFRNESGFWGLYVDGVLADQSAVMLGPADVSTPNQWYEESFTFIATDTTLTLRLEAFTTLPGENAYLGIDGLRFTPIPIPAALPLLLTALGVLGVMRRR